MAAPTTYDNVADGAKLQGQLFAGKSFWVARRIPNRQEFLAKITSNGGTVVALERQADWMIADHFRRDCPAGSTSYEFVDKSIQQGKLLDPDEFPAGHARGSTYSSSARPPKSTRASFTADEDKLLYNWMRKAEEAGASVSGNEIYKEIEAKFPRHTWHSWRDRYLKKLRDMPPSAFPSSENASPAPPADWPPTNAPSAKSSNVTRAKPEPAIPEAVAVEEEYNVLQLAATFGPKDWEELYAGVEEIDENKDNKIAWAKLANAKGNQTAEQWRQYYEKVVRPQWLRDPVSKREEIRKKFKERHIEESVSRTRDVEGVKDAEYIEDASTTLVVGHAILPEELMPPKELPLEPSPTAANNKHLHQATTTSLPDMKLMSSSTARHESPKFITELYETTRKRIREIGDTEKPQEPPEVLQPAKRRKSASMSPTLVETAQQAAFVGSQKQPLEISSTASSSFNSQEEEVDEQLENHPMSDAMQMELQLQGDIAQERDIFAPSDSEDGDDTGIPSGLPLFLSGKLPCLSHASRGVQDNDVQYRDSDPELEQLDGLWKGDSPSRGLGLFDNPEETAHYADWINPKGSPLQSQQPVPDDTSSDLPSNTSTPRAIHTLPAAFDNQAVVPSSSQDIIPTEHPESDASTTQSLQEFRRSLNENDDSMSNMHLHRLPLPAPLSSAPPSPARSTTSSTGSGDPDMPLDASELDDFYSEMHEQGFSNDFITKALKRTRLRPELAATVLDAWREGLPLPNQRGIWSIEDDEAVESGDGVALALLERKHSLDGWGGITERIGFLQTWRGR